MKPEDKVTLEELMRDATQSVCDKLHGIAVQLGTLNTQLLWLRQQVQTELDAQKPPPGAG